ncbi:hypothetical protein [Sinorhizobium meliloti]|uniref:hypothetical protein n=1 Tax=Rhizobium meliloti TaxID=382 RepID=UPI0013E29DF0|nr:hypothetical protein [Sinorhizobium meliloti]
MNAEQIKATIIRCATSLNATFSEHNARLLNEHCAKLFSVTGEVYSRGQFVKVA